MNVAECRTGVIGQFIRVGCERFGRIDHLTRQTLLQRIQKTCCRILISLLKKRREWLFITSRGDQGKITNSHRLFEIHSRVDGIDKRPVSMRVRVKGEGDRQFSFIGFFRVRSEMTEAIFKNWSSLMCWSSGDDCSQYLFSLIDAAVTTKEGLENISVDLQYPVFLWLINNLLSEKSFFTRRKEYFKLLTPFISNANERYSAVLRYVQIF